MIFLETDHVSPLSKACNWFSPLHVGLNVKILTKVYKALYHLPPPAPAPTLCLLFHELAQHAHLRAPALAIALAWNSFP